MTKPIGFDNWVAFSFIFNASERDFTAIGSFLINESAFYKLYRGPSISSTTAGTATVVTTSEAHGFSTGQSVRLYGLLDPLTSLNANHIITKLTSTTFSIPVSSSTSSVNIGAIAGYDVGLGLTSTGVTAIPGKNCMAAHQTEVDAATAQLGNAWDRAWIG